MPMVLIEAIGRQAGEKLSENPPDKWRVRLIEAGISHNGAEYGLGVLHKAAPLFEGVRAIARADEDHVKDRGKRPQDVAGWFSNVAPVAEGLDADFNIAADQDWLKVKLADSWDRGKKDLLGFSIVAEAKGRIARQGGRLVRKIGEFTKARFVDVVVNPSAGGQLVGLAEAENGDTLTGGIEMLEKLLKIIEAKAPDQYKKLDLDNLDEAKVLEIAEALMDGDPKTADDDGGKDKGKIDKQDATDDTKVAEADNADSAKAFAALIAEAKQEIADMRARDKAEATFDRLFAESGLPGDSRDRVARCLEGEKPATTEVIAEALKDERGYLGRHTSWRGPGSTPGATLADVTADERDKWKAAVTGMFTEADEPLDPAKPDGPKQRRYLSLREAYLDLTGDIRFTGMVEECPRLTAEANIESSTWAQAMKDAMNVRMQREYKRAPFGQWRAIADVVPVSDFRPNHRPQLGGFGNLADVSEGAAYQDFGTAPGDFATTAPNYTIGKKGALQPVTIETIANDNVGAVRQIPIKAGRAAARTLNTAAWYQLLTNANWTGDSKAIGHADHGGNVTTDALSPAAITAGRLAMSKQTEQGSNERLGLSPRFLVVPEDLRQKAREYCGSLVKPETDRSTAGATENEGVLNFIHDDMQLQPLVLPHWTSTTGWLLIGDKGDCSILEVGFFGGKEEPEIFIQDMPNSGSLFSNDMLTYKLRFIFGVGVLDYRNIYVGMPA